MARPKTLRPADFAVMTTTAVLLNVRHDLATPAELKVTQAPAEGAFEVLVVGEGGVGQRGSHGDLRGIHLM